MFFTVRVVPQLFLTNSCAVSLNVNKSCTDMVKLFSRRSLLIACLTLYGNGKTRPTEILLNHVISMVDLEHLSLFDIALIKIVVINPAIDWVCDV
ncbi:hypothetical protein ST37_00540 [Vibrio sp. qd031]|nr:hypothetical protein ST37_00540 [Vibrio sp. qd031]